MAPSTAAKNSGKTRASKRALATPDNADANTKKVRTVGDENATKSSLFEDITSTSDEDTADNKFPEATAVRFKVPSVPSKKEYTKVDDSGLSAILEAESVNEAASRILKRNSVPTALISGLDGRVTRPDTPMPGSPVTESYSDAPPALELAYPDTNNIDELLDPETVEMVKAHALDRVTRVERGLDSRGRLYNARFPRSTVSDDQEDDLPVVGKLEPARKALKRTDSVVTYVSLTGGKAIKEESKSWAIDLTPTHGVFATPSGGVTTKTEPKVKEFVQAHYGFVNPGYVTPDAMRRIVTMALRDNPIAHRFTLSNLPLSAKWGGATPDGEDFSRYLCVNNHPIRVTVAGRVTTSFFFMANGEPQARVNIGIVPLRKEDYASYNALLNDKANPKLSEEREVIYAARFQSERVRGMTAQKIVPYNRVFDMQAGSTIKRQPQSASMIADGDIVMLECNVYRFKPASGPGNRRSSRSWETWVVLLELQDIIYLFQSPNGDEGAEVGEFVPDGEEY